MAKKVKKKRKEVVPFMGFEYPHQNWSKLPHIFFNHMADMTEAELKVILYVLRHTWGFSEFDSPKRITLDEFCSGRKRKNGTRMDRGTGLSIAAVKEGLQQAVEEGYLIQIGDNRDLARHSHEYQLRMADASCNDSEDTNRLPKFSSQPLNNSTRSEKDTVERNLEKNVVSENSKSIPELPQHDYLHDALNLAQKQQPIHELRQRILEVLADAMDRELPDDAFFLKDWENARDALIGQCQTIAKKEKRIDKLHKEIESAIYAAKQADGWQFGDADYPTKAILHRIVRAYREREWTIPLADPYAGVKEL